MVVYFLDKNTLEIKDVVNASKFNLKFDEETNATSNITFHRKPNANQNDFIVVKKANITKYQGIISEIQGEKKSNQVEVICKDISNLFNRKIYVDGETYMEISLEDYLYYNINKFFKQGDDDSKTAMPYLSIVQSTQTSVTEPINDEDGIYNFHTFMTNCRQNKNISVNFEIKQEEIVVTIENIGNQDVVKIDTTNNDVIKYNKVYEMNITSRVIVKCGDTGNILNYYLLTDRTITTDKTNVNRASGDINTIYVDEEEKAYEQAVNIFKGNRYNHLVEFEIKQDSKLVETDELTIGRPIKIKTNDGILDSYISSIEIEEKSNYIKYKSGNIRVDLIDKLKQEPYKIGINKLDKASVKKEISNSLESTYNCNYINKIGIYSTVEVKTGGTWMGKPIYRKVLYYDSSSTKSQSMELNPNIDNLDEFVDIRGKVKRTSSDLWNSLPCTYTNWEIYLYDFSYNLTKLRFSNNQWSSGIDKFSITYEYTKTTD